MLFIVKFFLTIAAVVLIILVMLQRGKGGGLAGALGGMGGQSAFGTKAGDLFTKITVGVALFWILISVATAIYAPHLGKDQVSVTKADDSSELPAGTSVDSGAGKALEKSGSSEKADKGGKLAIPGAAEKGAKGSEAALPAFPAPTAPLSPPAPSSSPGK
jgi:preprotein translocase subunit SecG